MRVRSSQCDRAILCTLITCPKHSRNGANENILSTAPSKRSIFPASRPKVCAELSSQALFSKRSFRIFYDACIRLNVILSQRSGPANLLCTGEHKLVSRDKWGGGVDEDMHLGFLSVQFDMYHALPLPVACMFANAIIRPNLCARAAPHCTPSAKGSTEFSMQPIGTQLRVFTCHQFL
jgi:hypothetical protein